MCPGGGKREMRGYLPVRSRKDAEENAKENQGQRVRGSAILVIIIKKGHIFWLSELGSTIRSRGKVKCLNGWEERFGGGAFWWRREKTNDSQPTIRKN